MKPAQAIKTCLAKSVQFKGRASRSEFWWFVPFGFATVSVVCILLQVIMQLDPTGALFLALLTLSFVPLTSAASRRLRDVGAAPLNLAMPISIVFAILMLFMGTTEHAKTMASLIYLLPLVAVCLCFLAVGGLLGLFGALGIFSKMGETIGYLLLPSIEPISELNPNEVPA